MRKMPEEIKISITDIRKRMIAIVVAAILLFLFAGVRTFFVTVVDGEKLRAKAIDQWTRELPLKPERGKIFDCTGKVLADSETVYGVYVRPRSLTDITAVCSALSSVLGIDEKTVEEKIKNAKTSEVKIKGAVERSVAFSLEDYSLDGVYFSPESKRVYPYNEVLSRVIGYTDADGLGQTGIEKYYDEFLRGENGEILYESDLVGKDIKGKKPSYIAATDGLDVTLSIDLDIQLIAEKAAYAAQQKYTPKSSSVIVLEPSTGRIRALATYPSFDLNSPPRDDLTALNALSRNIVVADSYEPGSTFKIVTSLADIEETLSGNKNALPLDYVFSSSRYRVVDGKKIKCWASHTNGRHSNERLSEALNNSCNPCFVDIALALGKTKMYEYISGLNFGKTTGVDFPGEAAGMIVPVSAVTDGDLARISFGQTIAVTPLQLAAAASAAVNGGKYYSPSFVEKITVDGKTVIETEPKLKRTVASKKASSVLSSYLERVVSEGSGKQAYIEGYKVGGKTGTAQKYENGRIAQGKYVMSFVGFFPSDNPRYLALAVIDEPVGGMYGSTVAAPVVKEVFEGIIKQKRIKPYV